MAPRIPPEYDNPRDRDEWLSGFADSYRCGSVRYRTLPRTSPATKQTRGARIRPMQTCSARESSAAGSTGYTELPSLRTP